MSAVFFRKPKSKAEWFALLAGAAIVYSSGTELAAGFSSLSWKKTPAMVVYSTPRNSFRSYFVDVRYQYAYQGRDYLGERYHFQFGLTRNRMRTWQVDAIQARYPVGAHFDVTVNPSNPSESVIVPGVNVELFCWTGLGLLMMIASFVESRKSRGKPVPQLRSEPAYPVSTVLSVAGCLVLLYGISILYRGWASKQWPVTDGKVVYSSARRTGQNHTTLLWYEYFVGSGRYMGDNYRIGGNASPFQDVAVEAAKRYPVGAVVKVHYNPSNATESVLEPGTWYGSFVIPVIGLVLLAVGWAAKKIREAGPARRY